MTLWTRSHLPCLACPAACCRLKHSSTSSGNMCPLKVLRQKLHLHNRNGRTCKMLCLDFARLRRGRCTCRSTLILVRLWEVATKVAP